MQLLWLVKVPAAAPQIALGINQSVVMLAVAALVGSRGLGQEVYIELGKADAGLGLMAGSCIALIAISVDRTFACAFKSESPPSRL
jgi:glycine betaine/proline transport system permease protein